MKAADEILDGVEAENRATVKRLAREFGTLWDGKSAYDFGGAVIEAVEKYGPRVVRFAFAVNDALVVCRPSSEKGR